MHKANPISIFITLILTSFYLFPFCFSFLPTVNTKMMLAACGLVMFLFNLGKHGGAKLNTDFAAISLIATGVGMASFLTMVVNNTNDNSYLTYLVSMWVWLGGAYCIINIIRQVHGELSVELLCSYMIAVGVGQCLMAIAINNIYPLKTFVDSHIAGEKYMGVNVKGRLYSAGCALDVGGGRIAGLIILAGFLLPRMFSRKHSAVYIISLLCAIFIMTVIGSMIGRTAIIGTILTFAYWIYTLLFSNTLSNHRTSFIYWIFGSIILFIAAAVALYQFSSQWEKLFRFGFEGFFCLYEKGHWEVTSNEMLRDGYIFPDNLRGWIIGDGYMSSANNDPYYTGEYDYGFYKNTDAGYCRFIFYFGLIGLTAFAALFMKSCQICMRKFNKFKLMFFTLMILNFIIWIKVSTDIFLLFAPFLCISKENNDKYEQSLIERRKNTFLSAT